MNYIMNNISVQFCTVVYVTLVLVFNHAHKCTLRFTTFTFQNYVCKSNNKYGLFKTNTNGNTFPVIHFSHCWPTPPISQYIKHGFFICYIEIFGGMKYVASIPMCSVILENFENCKFNRFFLFFFFHQLICFS